MSVALVSLFLLSTVAFVLAIRAHFELARVETYSEIVDDMVRCVDRMVIEHKQARRPKKKAKP